MARTKKRKPKSNAIIKHLRGDIKTFHHEAKEDRELINRLSSGKKKKKKKAKDPKKSSVAQSKIHKVMKEFKEGVLHSGSKKGPKVKSRRQAVAIALSESRRAKKKKIKKSR